MREAKKIIKYIGYGIVFIPVFVILVVLGVVKIAFFGPLVCLLIAFGDIGLILGLLPCHLFFTIYCIFRTEKFGPWMKCLLVIPSPIPILLWTVVGMLGTFALAVYYAVVWPVMQTFKAISKEDSSTSMKLLGCVSDGTLSSIWGACTTVRDFSDFSFYSYFSVMDDLLESTGDDLIELKVLQIPGCILCATLGVVVDVMFIPMITSYKAPILLIKGWHRLLEDLIGREGPFLETVCVPFAGLLVLLWPIAVLLAVIGGFLSSLGFGCYAAIVAYQEESAIKGLLYVVASVSIFDEYTNDLIYLREGFCFPRPAYREEVNYSSLLPVKGLHERLNTAYKKGPHVRTHSEMNKALNAMLITSLNRPEGGIFDWLFEPMSIMKEQLKILNWEDTEELYLHELCLYNGVTARTVCWDNGGIPPQENIRRAQLEGISRRLLFDDLKTTHFAAKIQ